MATFASEVAEDFKQVEKKKETGFSDRLKEEANSLMDCIKASINGINLSKDESNPAEDFVKQRKTATIY